MSSSEYTQVELPFIEQLHSMGWTYLEDDAGVSYLTEQESFRQVLLTGRLREALACITLMKTESPGWTRRASTKRWAARSGRPRRLASPS